MRDRRTFSMLTFTVLCFLVVTACGQYENVHEAAFGQPGSSSAIADQIPGIDPTDPTLREPMAQGSGEIDVGSAPPGAEAAGPGGTTSPQQSQPPQQGEPQAPGPTSSAPPPERTDAAYEGEVGVTDDTIKIGYMYPKSGPIAALVRHVEPAIQAAAAEVNAAGGIHGRMVEFVTADDGYNNGSTAMASAKSLQDRVFGLTTYGLAASTVVAPWANDNAIPMISGNLDRATALKMTYVFTPSTFLETSAGILPTFIQNHLKKGGEKVGVIYQDTPELTVVTAEFRAAAEQRGMEVVIEQQIGESPPSCANEASKVQAAGATVVVMISTPVPAIQCLKDSRAIGYEPTWTGIGSSWNFNVTNDGSGGLTEGIQMLANSRTLESEEGQRYAAAMRKHYPNSDGDENDLALYAWGQVHLWFEGLRRAGPEPTRDGFVAAMETMDGWDGGLFAPTRFAVGDRSGPRETIVVQAKNRKWVTVDPVWRSKY